MTLAGEDTTRIDVALAALLADLPNPVPGDDYPEPWRGLVAQLASLPLWERLEALGNELERIPGIDVDAFLSRVFQIDPRNPKAGTPLANSFTFSPLYKGKRETESLDETPTPSTPITSTASITFQGTGSGETNSPGLRTVSLEEFLRVQDSEIQWCVDRLFPTGGVSIVAAPGGYGKSWMLLDLAIECARGGRWLGRFQTTAVRVLYVDEESSERLLRHRLRKSLRGKGLRGEDLDIHFAVGQGFSLSNPQSVAQLRRLLEELQPGLVIIDSLIRVHAAEENSATEMSKVFAVVKDLVRQSGATFIFADHQRKPGHVTGNLEFLLRGSSEKMAFVDCLLSMQRKDGTLIIEHSKSRFAEPAPSFVVRIEDPEPGATVVRCLGDAEGLKAAAKREEVEEFLRAAIPAGEWVARKDLVARSKAEGISSRLLDETLKTLVAGKQLDRDDRKPSDGRGGKQAHYRWRGEPTTFHVAEPPETESEGVFSWE